MGDWTSQKEQLNAKLQRLEGTIQTQLTFLQGPNINNIANGTTGANDQRYEAVGFANQALADLASEDRILQEKIKTTLQSQETIVNQTSALRNEIQKDEDEHKKIKELYDIRKEQAKSLQTKYDGNLHSSWMGLWVPLSEEFRAILIVTAIALFAGIITLVFFLIQGGYVSFRRRSIMGGLYGPHKV